VLLTDERLVEPASERSNTRLLHETLLREPPPRPRSSIISATATRRSPQSRTRCRSTSPCSAWGPTCTPPRSSPVRRASPMPSPPTLRPRRGRARGRARAAPHPERPRARGRGVIHILITGPEKAAALAARSRRGPVEAARARRAHRALSRERPLRRLTPPGTAMPQRHRRPRHRPHRRALPAPALGLSRPRGPRPRRRPGPRASLLRQPGPCLCRDAGADKDTARPLVGRQSRDRHRLQRHALGASALRALPRDHPPRRPLGRRHRPGRGRRAGHVRRRHPGPARHGAVALLARRDRARRRRRDEPQHLRRRVYLGICDKIVPGLVIAAATFGHVPAVFIPGGPMTSGLPNDEKSRSASNSPPARSAATS
jgi:hypothetical protein